MRFEYRPYPKEQQVKSKRIKQTQRQMGDISPAVDAELKARSQGVCEFCGAARATERAHITGRKQLDHKTKVTDLLHTCTECHRWLDGTVEGIRARRCMAMLMKARE